MSEERSVVTSGAGQAHFCVSSWRVAVAGKELCTGGIAKNSDGKSGIELVNTEDGGNLNFYVYPGGKDVKETAETAVLSSLLEE